MKRAIAILAALAGLVATDSGVAQAGFKTPESAIQNLYAFYGDKTSELSSGFPRDPAVHAVFFTRELGQLVLTAKSVKHDFFIQDWIWKQPLAIEIKPAQYGIILREELARPEGHYWDVSFQNMGRQVSLRFKFTRENDDWLISDVIGNTGSYRDFLRSVQQ